MSEYINIFVRLISNNFWFWFFIFGGEIINYKMFVNIFCEVKG